MNDAWFGLLAAVSCAILMTAILITIRGDKKARAARAAAQPPAENSEYEGAEHYIKTLCPLCGGSIEFLAEGAGQWVECPHCNQKIQLHRPVPESIKRLRYFANGLKGGKNKWIVWGYIFAVIWPIAGALIGAYFLLVKKNGDTGRR